MSVQTIFTKISSKELFETLISGFRDGEGNVTLEGIDVVGYLYTDPIVDEEDNIVTPSVRKEGYHVNFLNEVPQIFKQYIIPRPETPTRVFAGDDPILESRDGIDNQ